MHILSTLNDMSASEGFPIVLLSGLQAFGALALIVAVLLIMDKIFKKKHPEWDGDADNKDENAGIEKEEEDEK